MDDIDQRIVALLRENARRSFQDIGARVALSAPAVKRRVDRRCLLRIGPGAEHAATTDAPSIRCGERCRRRST